MKMQAIVEVRFGEIGKVTRRDRHLIDVEFDLEVAMGRFAQRHWVRRRFGTEEARVGEQRPATVTSDLHG